jgi:hypothetical protein
MIALRPSIIVPGHGPVLRDDSYLRLMAELFTFIKHQMEAAVSRGESLEQARKSINLVEFRKKFVGESPAGRLSFGTYVVGPAVGVAYREASARR